MASSASKRSAPPAVQSPAEAPTGAGKKPKLVRDSFTIPKTEYAAIDSLKGRALAAGRSVKKSEVLRAGLLLLTQLDDTALDKALAAVPPLKTGRPKQPEAAKPTPARAAPSAKASAKVKSEKAAKPAKPAKTEHSTPRAAAKASPAVQAATAAPSNSAGKRKPKAKPQATSDVAAPATAPATAPVAAPAPASAADKAAGRKSTAKAS